MADYLQHTENDDATQLPDPDTAPEDGSEDVDTDTIPPSEDGDTGGEIFPPEQPSPPPSSDEPPYFIVATTTRGFAYLAKQQADKAEPNSPALLRAQGLCTIAWRCWSVKPMYKTPWRTSISDRANWWINTFAAYPTD